MSNRPADIPEDVWDDANLAIDRAWFPGGDMPTAVLEFDIRVIASRAILAERERCAKVAANHFDLRHADKARFVGANIADAIREGEAP